MIQAMDWAAYWSSNFIHVRDLKVHQDDRGYLFEMLHDYDLPRYVDPLLSQYVQSNLASSSRRFGQVYVVGNPARGAVRAFHKHRVLWDYFTIVSGTAKFCFVDDRGNGRTLSTKSLVVSGDRPQMITVPPGVYHGWKSLTDSTILLSVGSEVYNSGKPDEVRVPPDHFNGQFGGDPWEVKGR